MRYSTSYIGRPEPQGAGRPLLLQLLIFNLSIYLRTCPHRRVNEKSNLFHTNHRSGRDRGSKPGHLCGRQRRKPLSYPLRLFIPVLGGQISSYNAAKRHLALAAKTRKKPGDDWWLGDRWQLHSKGERKTGPIFGGKSCAWKLLVWQNLRGKYVCLLTRNICF
jgi:hypothetical protein